MGFVAGAQRKRICFFMEWLAEPNTYIGLITLILLEIVLGIDNLVFIAILAERLPAGQRHRARITGLFCALLMRLFLLSLVSYMAHLTRPLFSLAGFDFSARGLIMIFGGVFLLGKATMELHERLEGGAEQRENRRGRAVFWQVIAQIVILDAVFSLDSIITAVGMVQHVPIMMAAVIIAMGLMILASGILTNFVSRHPTIVILCLGFLMMIGFSLVVEGFGFEVPKGYLYAAIGFSVLIEAFNQIGRYNRKKRVSSNDLRSRTADAVLRLLGGGKGDSGLSDSNVDIIAEHAAAAAVFRPEEKQMIRGVLDLAERPVRSIMSPRHEVEWLDLTGKEKKMRAELEQLKHSRIILAREKVDEFVGVAFTKDLLLNLAEGKRLNWQKSMRQPLVVHENTNVLRLMERLRRSPVQLAIVVDEHGSFEGIVTPTDILEAIAGDFPDDDDEAVIITRESDNSLIAEGYADIRRLSGLLDCDLVDDSERYTTLAGYILWHFGHLPQIGEAFEADGFRFEVLEKERRNISKVRITALPKDEG